jgi:ABC-type glycerol-3-phosphate transport system substrate-binding protein
MPHPPSRLQRPRLSRRALLLVTTGALGSLPGSQAACRTGSQGAPPALKPATLLMVNWGDIPQGWRDLGARFTERQPAIRVEFSGITAGRWGEYFEKVAVMAAAGSPPDVARVAIEGTQLIAHNGLALPLDPFIKRDQAQLREYFADINQNMLRSMSYQGRQYQLPFTWNGPVVHYNTQLFAEAGIARPRDDWTIDDFVAIARRLTRDTDGDGQPDIWGVTTPNAYWGGIIPWIFLAGGDLLTDDWTASRASSAEVIEAVEFYASLSRRHRVAPPRGAGVPFAGGKAGMAINAGGNLRLATIQAGLRDFDILYFPKWRTQTHEYGGTGFPILCDSRHHEESWVLVKFLIEKESIAAFVATVSQTPARRSVAYDLWVKPGEPPAHYRIYFDMLDRGAKAVPAPPEYNEVEQIVLKHLGAVLADEAAPRAAMEQAHKEISAVLARRTAPVACARAGTR